MATKTVKCNAITNILQQCFLFIDVVVVELEQLENKFEVEFEPEPELEPCVDANDNYGAAGTPAEYKLETQRT